MDLEQKLIKGESQVSLSKKRTNLMSKILIAFIATLILSVGVGHYLSYEFGFETTNVAEASLKGAVKKNNGTSQLEKTVDKAGNEIVKLARDVAIVVAVIVIVWAAYSLFVKRSAEGLADMKGRMGVLLLAIALIFFTEQILGAILGMFGVKL